MDLIHTFFFQGLNGILADEMGLGKTIQAMAFLAHLAEVINHSLEFLDASRCFINFFCFIGKKYMGAFSGGCSCFCLE